MTRYIAMNRLKFPIGAALLLLLAVVSSTYAQRPADDWTALLERRDGWLGADGIFSVDLNLDVRTGRRANNMKDATLLIFSDTVCGATRDDGREYDGYSIVNHSFGLLSEDAPRTDSVEFFWRRPGSETPPGERPENIVEGRYWLQDGLRYGDEIRLSAILVGEGWKPKRIDALSFPYDPTTQRPDFSRPKLDKNAPLSLETKNDLVVMGPAICDDAEDGFLYIYGYVDRLREFSRKDAVVARVPRDKLDDYEEWRFYDGQNWQVGLETTLKPDAPVARGVSAEFSVSRIPKGKASGKWLLVYTPGTISNKVAFRIGETPVGPFGAEHVFWRSKVPNEIRGVQCYNAKAHPALSDDNGTLVSYNVNRLGSLPRRPAEYRPRFVWLDWETIDEAFLKDARREPDRP
jgi:hypothetical protein